MNPDICHPKWICDVKPLSIKTLQHHIHTNKKAILPCFKELGSSLDVIEFYILRFHDFYDGIIGNDLLGPLRACIDYKSNTLRVDGNILQLFFETKSQWKNKSHEEDS